MTTRAWSWLMERIAGMTRRITGTRERSELELEARLAQSQLQILRMQLQPHFVLNVLNAISGLMARDVDAAREMIARLGDLLRLAMQADAAHEIPLRQELDFLRLYLDLQRLRFQDRLVVEFDVDPSVLDVLVPRMLLQPIVENSLEHGLAASGAAGRVEVRAEPRDGGLRLEVWDDGPGPCVAAPTMRVGVGVGNTRARLRALYGDAHRFELGNSGGGGCVVIIEIPRRTTPYPEPAG